MSLPDPLAYTVKIGPDPELALKSALQTAWGKALDLYEGDHSPKAHEVITLLERAIERMKDEE